MFFGQFAMPALDSSPKQAQYSDGAFRVKSMCKPLLLTLLQRMEVYAASKSHCHFSVSTGSVNANRK